MAKKNKFLTKISLLNKCRKLHISTELLDFIIVINLPLSFKFQIFTNKSINKK